MNVTKRRMYTDSINLELSELEKLSIIRVFRKTIDIKNRLVNDCDEKKIGYEIDIIKKCWKDIMDENKVEKWFFEKLFYIIITQIDTIYIGWDNRMAFQYTMEEKDLMYQLFNDTNLLLWNEVKQ